MPSTLDARVVRVDTAGPGVRRLILRSAEPFVYRPGQYLSLWHGAEPGRSFSMATAPRRDGQIELHIRRRPGGYISQTVLDAAVAGDVVSISGPYGEMAWQGAAGPVVMLATGTGIAPLRALLEQAVADRSTVPLTLYWGARTRAELYLFDELYRWHAHYPAFRFVPVLSAAGAGWGGTVGHCQEVAAEELEFRPAAQVYACGNPGMVDAARRVFAAHGLTGSAFQADAFEPAAGVLDAADVSAAAVTIAVDGKRLEGRAGQTILSAIKAAGLPVLSVCGGRQSCGTCLVHLHPDAAALLPPPAATERNLLTCLPGVEKHSRLACQIRLAPGLEGLQLRLGAESAALRSPTLLSTPQLQGESA